MALFDITCTATLRPELLYKTLHSHWKYLFKERIRDCRLIINIDFIGSDNIGRDYGRVRDVVYSIPFADYYLFIHDQPPHFGRAFERVMKEVKTDFFFNLEEDWELKMDLDFEYLLDLFLRDPELAHLRLSAFPSGNDKCKNWNRYLYWNGNYFEVPKELRGLIGWAGHPSMNSTSFMKECLGWINFNSNPEKQIKGRKFTHPMNKILEEHRFGSFHPQNAPPAIYDLGRQWMASNGYKKVGIKAFFTQWEKIK